MNATNNATSSRKMQRLENKKRKLRAYLELVQSNEENSKKKHKKEEKPQNSEVNDTKLIDVKVAEEKPDSKVEGKNISSCGYLELKHMKREVLKLKSPWPIIEPTDVGLQSLITLEDGDRKPLLLKDIQIFLLHLLMPGSFPIPSRWLRIIRARRISHVVTVLVEGVSMRELKMCLCKKKRKSKKEMFQNGKVLHSENLPENVSIVNLSNDMPQNSRVPSSNWLSHALPRVSRLVPQSFELSSSICHEKPWEELLLVSDATVPWNDLISERVSQEKDEGKQQYDNAWKSVCALSSNNNITENESDDVPEDIHPSDIFDRRQLLLSPAELYTLKYPVPYFSWCQENGFVFSKEKYIKVKPTSPMFAVDCEMCMTTANRLELASISVVNEEKQLAYYKLVKPSNRIINYLTQFSGITRGMLKNVTTTLHDVQQDLRELLPPDAILVGHSLDSDLKAMKMMHPYVIDSAVAYNLSFIKNKPSALKTLANRFLDKKIQMNPGGHDPTEDATTALELIQLKLKTGIAFGNVLQGFQLMNAQSKMNQNEQSATSNGNSEANGESQEYFNLFQHAAKSRVKTAVLMAPSASEECKKVLESISDNKVSIHVLPGNKQISEKAVEISMAKDFTYIHMKMTKLKSCKSRKERKEQIEKLDKRLRRIIQGACQKAMLMFILTGSSKNDSIKQSNGLVMCCIKGSEDL